MEKHPNLKKFLNIILGLVIIFLLLTLAIAALQYVGGLVVKGIEALSNIATKTDAVIIVALLTGAVSIVGVVISSIVAKSLEYKDTYMRKEKSRILNSLTWYIKCKRMFAKMANTHRMKCLKIY